MMRFLRGVHTTALLALAFTILPLGAPAAHSAGRSGQGDRDVTVMTRNLYPGASLQGVLAAPTFPALVAEVGAVWNAVQATDFPARAEALADEIEEASPDLIGLQEAVLWRIQSPGDLIAGGDVPATDVAYDFVEILLDELDARGLDYEVVVTLDQMDAELPGFTANGLDDIRLTDRDVILARADLPPGHLRILGTDSGHFENLLELDVGGVATVELTRGWLAADVKVRGKAFRFVNTHLEAESPDTQEAQAVELLEGPLDVNVPVICLGDFNSDAFGPGTDSYEILLDAGFEDAWLDAHPSEPGLTWGHADDLLNPLPNLTERLDLVLYRGTFTVADMVVVGDELEDRTDSGLWPSDHAGVVATFTIKGRFR